MAKIKTLKAVKVVGKAAVAPANISKYPYATMALTTLILVLYGIAYAVRRGLIDLLR